MNQKSAPLKIGILGTRGIPNRYGGFEECAEKLSLGLVEKGHNVWVYNSSHHDYRENSWQGVHIIHCKDPEPKLGTAGQFIYDYNCFTDARRRGFDVLLQLGYTSSSVWWRRWPKDCVNIVNMDGMEWQRSKFSPRVQKFLRKAERWAAVNADHLVADSVAIGEYLQATYGLESAYIPYGAILFENPDAAVPATYGLRADDYHLLIARMEPENNIETIINGYLQSGDRSPLVVVGNTGNKYGTYLKDTYGEAIRFTGGIYDAAIINNLRYFSKLYWHGHSVGGTNPSLLEAMGCHALIAAHRNAYNGAILGASAFAFSDAAGISAIIQSLQPKPAYAHWISANDKKIRDLYNWPRIVDQYEQLMLEAVSRFKRKTSI